MILGISGSPRKNGITAHAINEILKNIEGDTKYISLSEKKITGCISCLACVKTNKCVLHDDFDDISEELVHAEAIVIGIPNYYNMPNALSHSLLERCFSFRHGGNFLLKDKPIIILSTGYSKDVENSQSLKLIEHFALSNRMRVLKKFLVSGYSQCYDCPSGLTCVDGNIVRNNGFVDAVTKEMLPPKLHEQEDALLKCREAANMINNLLWRMGIL